MQNFICPEFQKVNDYEFAISGLSEGLCCVSGQMIDSVMDWDSEGKFWPFHITEVSPPDEDGDYYVRFEL